MAKARAFIECKATRSGQRNLGVVGLLILLSSTRGGRCIHWGGYPRSGGCIHQRIVAQYSRWD